MVEEHYPIFDLEGASELIETYSKMYNPCCDSPGLCFDDDYYAISEDLKTKPEIKVLTDIGCGFGTQNLFFPDKKYIGISWEVCTGIDPEDYKKPYLKIPFFREEEEGITYHIGKFPLCLRDEMIGDCFISNMSVGYCNMEKAGLTDEILFEGFSRFPCGYTRTTKEVHHVLEQIFPFKRIVAPSMFKGDSPLVFYSKTEK